jgi:predicted dehydrogenase
MTRVAVVGVGAMSKNHARVYHEMPETELVAVVDDNRMLALTLIESAQTNRVREIKR